MIEPQLSHNAEAFKRLESQRVFVVVSGTVGTLVLAIVMVLLGLANVIGYVVIPWVFFGIAWMMVLSIRMALICSKDIREQGEQARQTDGDQST